MKLRYYILILTLLLFGISNVNASSINYNLTIDKNIYFHETIVYKVKKSELDTSGNYDFLTSVVNGPIYFDNNDSVKYTKTKRIANDEYIITLKNDFSSIFVTSERIINECFNTFDFSNNDGEISIELSSPFFCLKRADNIMVNITTDLNVLDSNADSINGNKYTWNVDSKDFNLSFSAKIPELETEPMDEIDEEINDPQIDEDETNINDTENNKEQKEKNNSVLTIGLTVVGIIAIAGVIFVIILKIKKNKLNEI